MRVLIDGHMLGGRETGNERYILGLLQGLESIEADLEVIVAVSDLSIEIPMLPGWGKVRVSESPARRLGYEFPRIVNAFKADLLHVSYSGPLVCNCPLVVSVHDVSYLNHPEWFSLRDRLVLRMGVGLTMSHAKGVIALSRHACDEIRKHYHKPEGATAITPLAASGLFSPASQGQAHISLSAPNITCPYFLAVGNLQPRKNIPRIFDAFARIKQKHSIPHRLVVVGRAKWQESEIYSALERHNLMKDVVFLGYVPDERLVSLYQGAEAFIYPSLYEGFGLPILEAMACGTPVITSNTTSMPETAGAAALMVDPCDVEGLVSAMTLIVKDEELRRNLSRKGVTHSSQFTWERTAHQTVEAYRRWST
jgi:glycosyltransferase involved in cell wall biosynthesis